VSNLTHLNPITKYNRVASSKPSWLMAATSTLSLLFVLFLATVHPSNSTWRNHCPIFWNRKASHTASSAWKNRGSTSPWRCSRPRPVYMKKHQTEPERSQWEADF
jgi:hypothetical protein